MDLQHPVVRRTLPSQGHTPSYRTRLQRTAELCGRCEHRPSLTLDLMVETAVRWEFIRVGWVEKELIQIFLIKSKKGPHGPGT